MTPRRSINLEDITGKAREVQAWMVSFLSEFTQALQHFDFIDDWRRLSIILNADL
jgi:hypothetical protein